MPRRGKVGQQKSTDTGPLNTKRMVTCNDEFVAAAKDFIKRQTKAGKPWFVWLNTTHMHLFTHTKPRSVGQAGRWQSQYHDTMVDHDKNVGEMLALLDEPGSRTTRSSCPRPTTAPTGIVGPTGDDAVSQREEHQLGRRLPHPAGGAVAGPDRGGRVSNGIVQRPDWLPTFLAVAGAPDVVDKLKKGYTAIGQKFKNHIDGMNLIPYLTGKEKDSPRNFFIYFSDDGDMLGVRFDNWKVVFMEQRMPGTLGVWAEPFVRLRLPKVFNLRTDPYERAPIRSNTY